MRYKQTEIEQLKSALHVLSNDSASFDVCIEWHCIEQAIIQERDDLQSQIHTLHEEIVQRNVRVCISLDEQALISKLQIENSRIKSENGNLLQELADAIQVDEGLYPLEQQLNVFVKATGAHAFFCHFATQVQLEGIASSEREIMVYRSSRSSFCLSVAGEHASVIAFYAFDEATSPTSVTRMWTVSHSISTFLAYMSLHECEHDAFCHHVCFKDADLFRQRHHLLPETLHPTTHGLLPDAAHSGDPSPYTMQNEGF